MNIFILALIAGMALIIIGLLSAILIISRSKNNSDTNLRKSAEQKAVVAAKPIQEYKGEGRNQYDKTVSLNVRSTQEESRNSINSAEAEIVDIPKLPNMLKTEILRNIEKSEMPVSIQTELLEQRVAHKPIAVMKYLENNQSRVLEMYRDMLHVGRNPEVCDLVLLSDNYVGKHHAMIYNKNNKFFIVDMNSKNGTFVNGNRIVGNAEITGNCMLKFANTEVEFTIV